MSRGIKTQNISTSYPSSFMPQELKALPSDTIASEELVVQQVVQSIFHFKVQQVIAILSNLQSAPLVQAVNRRNKPVDADTGDESLVQQQSGYADRTAHNKMDGND